MTDLENEYEIYETGFKQKVWVHSKEHCDGGTCVIHNPSDHAMKNFRTLWRADRGLMERVCPHGVGHPDPDDIAFKRRSRGEQFAHYEEVHGCDGCCSKHGDGEQDNECLRKGILRGRRDS